MRKLLALCTALASIAFAVCSPAFADSCSRAFGYQGGTGCNSNIASGRLHAVLYGFDQFPRPRDECHCHCRQNQLRQSDLRTRHGRCLGQA